MIVNSSKAAQAATILGVELNGLTADALTRAYRTKAKDAHPDSADNYDVRVWADVSWAKEVLVRWLESCGATQMDAIQDAGDCRSCNGSGRVAVGKPTGFKAKPVTLMCVMCNGSGRMPDGGAKPYEGDKR